jgi:hypothetical protein
MKALGNIVYVLVLLGLLGTLPALSKDEGLLYLPGPGLPQRDTDKTFMASFVWDEVQGKCMPPVMGAFTRVQKTRRSFATRFTAELGSVLPVAGRTYVVDRVYCEPRPKGIPGLHKLEPRQPPPPPPPPLTGGAPTSGLYLRAVNVEGIELAEPDVVIPEAATERGSASLTYYFDVSDGKEWLVQVHWSELKQASDGAWQATVLVQEGHLPFGHQYLKSPPSLAIVQATRVTLRRGDAVNVPHLGDFLVKAILPPAPNRQAWLVLTPRPLTGSADEKPQQVHKY